MDFSRNYYVSYVYICFMFLIINHVDYVENLLKTLFYKGFAVEKGVKISKINFWNKNNKSNLLLWK